MKKISFDDLNTTFPKNNSFINDEEFLNLYSLCTDLIMKYLIKKLDLEKYDNYFSKSELNYKKVNENQMDVYQYLSSSNLKYFYLRNNLHLDRLSKEEIDFFRQKLDNQNEECDIFCEKIIESVISKLLSEREGDSTLTNFGPETSKFYAPMNSLIIGFRYDEFNSDGMTDEEWDINHEKQIQDRFHQIIMLENEIENYKIMPISIIEYDMFSVKQRKNDNNMTL